MVIILLITGILKLTEIIVNIIDKRGSTIFHVGRKYIIIEAKKTPTDYTKSPMI